MLNPALVKLLTDMSDLLELDEDNPFRIRAFRRAAQTIESYSQDLGSLDRKSLLSIPGIGKGIADIIEDVQKTGTSAEYQKIKKKFPEGVLQIMHLPGLGPKRAGILFKNLQIDSVKKLAECAHRGILKTLPGFGQKLEENILQNIAFAETASKRILITDAHKWAKAIQKHLIQSNTIKKCALAGSARRWRETVGDLDFVTTNSQPQKAIQHFLSFPNITKVLASGATKASVILNDQLQCDFRVVKDQEFGAALLYFTGSKEHNVQLREWALKKGFTLNEYGLFKLSDKEKKKPVAGQSEEDIYKHLGLAWIPPELREDRGEIEAARQNKLPRLVELKDILGDFHNHTNLSDGRDSLEQMVAAAQHQGWKWFFSADHSPSLKIASGLPVPILKRKINEVEKINRRLKNFHVYTSSEVDILALGAMDYADTVLSELDCVIASVHSRFQQDEKTMTERICNALKNPHVDILGHLTGRLINKRPSYALDIETVLQTAKETGTTIEINGQPERQELSDVHVKRAIELGIPLAVTTDAHSTEELDNIQNAVQIARRGWAEPQHIINTKDSKSIREWFT